MNFPNTVTVIPYRNGIRWIDVDNGLGLQIRLCTYGASVYSIRLNGTPLTLEVKDNKVFLNNVQFFGKTLGQVAGRINKIQTIDNVEYQLKADEKDNCLHGGFDTSLSFQNFKYEYVDEDNSYTIVFRYESKDLENGFPGPTKFEITYKISKRYNSFKIIFTSIGLAPATLVNLSNHIYWNFNTYDVASYLLKINASNYGEMNHDQLLVKKNIIPYYLDFTRAQKIDKYLNYIENKTYLKTIDYTYIFDELGKVQLRNDDIELNMETDYEAMNVYLDNSLTDIEFNNFEDSKHLRRGIAFEPQNLLLNKDSIILKANSIQTHYIKYRFKRRRTK